MIAKDAPACFRTCRRLGLDRLLLKPAGLDTVEELPLKQFGVALGPVEAWLPLLFTPAT